MSKPTQTRHRATRAERSTLIEPADTPTPQQLCIHVRLDRSDSRRIAELATKTGWSHGQTVAQLLSIAEAAERHNGPLLDGLLALRAAATEVQAKRTGNLKS